MLNNRLYIMQLYSVRITSIKNQMKGRALKLLIPIEEAVFSKRNTRNIHQFINRVPVQIKTHDQPQEAILYAQQQMKEYPPSSKELFELHQQQQKAKMEAKVQKKFKKDITLVKIALKLQNKLSYCEMEEMRSLLGSFTQSEIQKHHKMLQMVQVKVKYGMMEKGVEEHIMEAAKDLIREINSSLKKKVNQIV